jgi:hypothetical protein
MDGATVLGTAQLSNATASLSVQGLAAGSHQITAVYGGNTNFNGAASNAVTQVVQIATTTSLTANKLRAAEGQTVKFTAVAAPSAATGIVQFLDGVTVIGTVQLGGRSRFRSTTWRSAHTG